MRRCSIVELGENTGRRSVHSDVGRTNSNPEVVTSAHDDGVDGWPSDAAYDVPQRSSAVSAHATCIGGKWNSLRSASSSLPEERHRTCQALAAHAADPAQRALRDLALVEPEVAHARERDLADPAHGLVDHAVTFDDQPPVSVARVGRSSSRRRPRGTSGVSG